jgi:heme/copper-type cytochrome/quinol oxidase subunit 1
MTIDFGKHTAHIQFVPTYGLALGYLFYNPLQEPDTDEIEDEDYFTRHTLLLGIFALIVTVWES